MSEGTFWGRSPAALLVFGFVAFVIVATVPALLLGNYCSVENLNKEPGAYRVTVDRIETQGGSTNPINPPINQTSLGAQFPGSITTTSRTESAYYPPKEVGNWWRKFACDITGADYSIALFTLVLALVTFLLWHSTHKLWRAGEAQIKIAKLSTDAAVGIELPVFIAERFDSGRGKEKSSIFFINHGRSPAIVVGDCLVAKVIPALS